MSNPGIEWENLEKVEYELYQKYQIIIHNAQTQKCTLPQFRRFLIESPLTV